MEQKLEQLQRRLEMRDRVIRKLQIQLEEKDAVSILIVVLHLFLYFASLIIAIY